MDWFESSVICLFTTASLCFGATEAREYCGKLEGQEYYCNAGHCCGDFQCCANSFKYYEKWWFWLVWGLISLLGCCCAYHRRRYYSYHGQIRNFVYPIALRGSAEPLTPFNEELTVDDPKLYKLPSYDEVEAMGSLGPPTDGAGAPPPYVDPLADEDLEDEAINSQSNETFLDSTEDLRSSLIPPDTEVQATENP